MDGSHILKEFDEATKVVTQYFILFEYISIGLIGLFTGNVKEHGDYYFGEDEVATQLCLRQRY